MGPWWWKFGNFFRRFQRRPIKQRVRKEEKSDRNNSVSYLSSPIDFEIQVRITTGFFTQLNKLILKFIGKNKGSRITKTFPKKMNKVRGFFLWDIKTYLVAQAVKNPPAMWETWIPSLGQEDPLEKGWQRTPSILAWRIPMDRGAWWATVHRGAKSRTRLKELSTAHIKAS